LLVVFINTVHIYLLKLFISSKHMLHPYVMIFYANWSR